jgi:hypothetical protein
MTDQISFPALHDLPPGELQTRRDHLVGEIRRELETGGASLPTFTLLHRAAVTDAATGSARRRAAVVAVGLAAVLAAGLLAATWSQQADALPAPFQPAQTALADQFNVQVSPLPTSTRVAVSEQRAEQTVLKRYAKPPTGVTATLVSTTDSDYATSAPTGGLTPVISNRAAWLVLVPGQQAPIIYPMGKSGPLSYGTTSAVLIDANTGSFLLEAELPAKEFTRLCCPRGCLVANRRLSLRQIRARLHRPPLAARPE